MSAEICHSSRENTHNYKGHITRSKGKYLESGFNSNHHINQEINVECMKGAYIYDYSCAMYQWKSSLRIH